MRKGDEKRQGLLMAAEGLFCRKGIEAVSIQDLMTAMGLSKGGFYHHFTGKEAVLTALCERHAELSASALQEELARAVAPVERINAVLHAFMPLRREEIPFLRVLLPCLAKPEARTVALVYQEAMLADFLPLLRREVEAGRRTGVLCPPVRDMEHVVLHLCSRAFLDAAECLQRVSSGQEKYDPSALLTLLEKYRRAVEVLLDAPFGAIEIVRMEEMHEVALALSRGK